MSGSAEAAPTSRAHLRAMLVQSWHAFHPVPALYCLPAVLLSLAAGLALGQPGAAMLAASGAFLAGFGAFQRVSRLRVGPILLASLCTALATAIGTVAANNALAEALWVGLAAFTVGLGTGLGTGPWWVLLQGAIFIVLAGSQPGDLAEGMQRAGLVLAGGLLQAALVSLLRVLLPAGFPPLAAPGLVDAPTSRAEWAAAFRRLLQRRSPEPRFGLLLGLAAAAAVLLERGLGLPHGYWIAMTVLLVLRRGGGETVTRGILRIVGTLLGAGVATLVVALLKPSAPVLMALIGLTAWGAYSLQWVNYGTFSVAVTSYVAFLFSLQGAPEPVVAALRVEATLIGGALAMLAFGVARLWRRALERAGIILSERPS
jgi:hypothetical protein